MSEQVNEHGRIVQLSGPVVLVEGLREARVHDVVSIGSDQVLGEVIGLRATALVVQIYEHALGMKIGDVVTSTGGPLTVELGPGLLGAVFDGIQRPLPALAARDGDPYAEPFLARGRRGDALDRNRRWSFTPEMKCGERVAPGDVLGMVPEGVLVHRILVPPGVSGIVHDIASGSLSVTDRVALVGDTPVSMHTRWPVRTRRPVARRLDPSMPLVTGQRIIDTFFPVARGGVAIIPGGFGTGKTVTEQALARWSRADVVVYVACGERGNELTELIEQLPRLIDPRTGASLMRRTILIANTSNMPVAAREASIYTGVTLAEYYRDQGYDVALLADSTSRWGEALREVSGRLEEMPGEEGYPAYLPSRLAEFYERAGSVVALGRDERKGSVTVVGAVSPPGGDFSEPVTQYSLRLAGTFWALDTQLARRRHFPAIDWNHSYSLYALDAWFASEVTAEFPAERRWALSLLAREAELMRTVQLLGTDVLAPAERLVLHTGRILREDFLQQSAFDEVDALCPPEKQHWMLWLVRHAHETCEAAMAEGVELERIASSPVMGVIARMRAWPAAESEAQARAIAAQLDKELRP